MTTRFKDFGDGGTVIVEPLSFKLHDVEFKCKSVIQGKVLLDMVAMSGSENSGESASVLKSFLKSVMVADSHAEFLEMQDSDDKIVSIETIGELVGWLVGEYSGRPQEGPDNSQSGQ